MGHCTSVRQTEDRNCLICFDEISKGMQHVTCGICNVHMHKSCFGNILDPNTQLPRTYCLCPHCQSVGVIYRDIYL
jgi:hypothetical protein